MSPQCVFPFALELTIIKSVFLCRKHISLEVSVIILFCMHSGVTVSLNGTYFSCQSIAYINGLVQAYVNYSASAMELPQSCAKPSISTLPDAE